MEDKTFKTGHEGLSWAEREKLAKPSAMRWDAMFLDWLTGKSKKFPPLAKVTWIPKVRIRNYFAKVGNTKVTEHDCHAGPESGCGVCPKQYDA